MQKNKKRNQNAAVKAVRLREEKSYDKFKEITTQIPIKSTDQVFEEIKAMNIAIDLENFQLIAGWLLSMSMVKGAARPVAELAVQICKRLIPQYNALLKLQFKEVFKKFICPESECVLQFKTSKLIPLFKEMNNLEFFEKGDIFEMLEYLGKSVVYEDLINILQFVENFQRFFDPKKLSMTLQERTRLFAGSLMLKTSNASSKDKKIATKILTALHFHAEESETADYDFDELVLKLKSEENLQEVLEFKAPEKAAENFLRSSIKLRLNKKTFADFIEKTSATSTGSKFQTNLLKTIDALFKKQHHVTSRKGFTEREAVATTEFITELMMRRIMQVEQGKELLTFTGDQGIVPTTSKCILLLNKALHVLRENAEAPKSRDESM